MLVDQAVQRVVGGAGEFLQCRAHDFGDQFESGQVAHGGQDVGGVGALSGALADQSGLLQTGQGDIEEAVRPAVALEAVAEVAEHAVVEAGIVEFEAERVLEVDTATHRLGGIAVRQAQQELQYAHRGQLGG
nr:hypothetical protein [Amycolatopsis balhimycina]